MNSSPDKPNDTPSAIVRNFRLTGQAAGTVALADLSILDDLVRIFDVRYVVPSNGRPGFVGWPSKRSNGPDGEAVYQRLADCAYPLDRQILDQLEAAYEDAVAAKVEADEAELDAEAQR